MSIEQQAEEIIEREDLLSIRPVDFMSLAGKIPPPRRWVVQDWLPRGTVTLLSGRGGVGKSLLAQQLGTAVAAEKHWLGEVPNPGSVIGLFCEDDHDELWRRQVDICRHFGLSLDGAAEWLVYDARAGKSNSLTYHDPKTGIIFSPLLEEIRQAITAAKEPRLLILDNVAQMFQAGNGGESDRGLVTAFCNRLTGIALEFDIAILLLAHPAKADGSEYSGSTAWDAAVRSRLFLTRESDDPASRVILKRAKANYAALGGDITLVWDKGAFIRSDGRQSLEEQAASASREREAEQVILDALAWLEERKLSASHKKRAGNYLPKQMKAMGQAAGFSIAELGEAVDRLISDMRIEVDAFLWKDGNRNNVQGLKRVG